MVAGRARDAHPGRAITGQQGLGQSARASRGAQRRDARRFVHRGVLAELRPTGHGRRRADAFDVIVAVDRDERTLVDHRRLSARVAEPIATRELGFDRDDAIRALGMLQGRSPRRQLLLEGQRRVVTQEDGPTHQWEP